jgi:Domain of Unknown Function (DUF1080)
MNDPSREKRMRNLRISLALVLTVGALTFLYLQAAPGKGGVWTDPADSTLPASFKVQGEYASEGDKIGVQVIALGGDALQAVVYPGGLPGAGWDGKEKSLMQGTIDGTKAKLEPATGKRKYLAQKPNEFSATDKFPPVGQKEYSATTDGEAMSLQTEKGTTVQLKKVTRQSPTMGAKPPEGAIILFDGTDISAWNGGRLDKETKFLNTDGHDITSKQKFNNYTAHVEFLLPYKPEGRGQGRGNSGFYQVQHYEVQILDSFGLDGKNNECAGVYTKAAPKVNMCLPPLVWQTYDAEFTNAVRDESGKKVKNARLTLKHNGVVVHDDIEITGPTGGHRGDPEGTPGPILLQGHGNPLQFRNVWVVEKK